MDVLVLRLLIQAYCLKSYETKSSKTMISNCNPKLDIFCSTTASSPIIKMRRLYKIQWCTTTSRAYKGLGVSLQMFILIYIAVI